MKTTIWMPAVVLAALLAGCGGGGGDASPAAPADQVPASASASVAGMLSWLKQLAGSAPEDREALDTSTFAPPQPDDSEPEVLR
ncbi:MAG: hypothetical protein KF788_11340 [Piscinibacter sp.]|nr:hypothetical protein [Piscinibacter sp.]